ncbi:Acg family FMN-binding oxidoreductase [Pseudonocardia bannensis]|uniref:NAD(P)H nitroreductase n=1 Tax=Pseudonocardia bannensis TaxID=630973 RepID=A0A848DNK5_9PSEU|nr:NAD(P)H nitroreductase [Pseudonocardia bannensis]NMH94066.1 NAD(P)H nitroreductase [Pseudonocardia bannensis]
MSTEAIRCVDRLPGADAMRRAVELALRAPSVQNSQPWRWRVRRGSVELHADDGRHRSAEDPDRRDLVISCGAALHHLRVALAGAGWACRVTRLPDPGEPAHLATVEAVPGLPDRADAQLRPMIDRRRTDRRRFGLRPVRRALLDTLRERAAAEGTGLHPLTCDAALARLDAALAEAATRIRYVIGTPDELTVWPEPGATPLQDRPPDHRRAEARAIGAAAADGSCLLVLTTPADSIADRLATGEAASAVLLTATGLGLASTLLSQALTTTRARRPDAPAEHPQVAVRVGWPTDGAARLPATPRRLLDSVLLPD